MAKYKQQNTVMYREITFKDQRTLLVRGKNNSFTTSKQIEKCTLYTSKKMQILFFKFIIYFCTLRIYKLVVCTAVYGFLKKIVMKLVTL